MGLAGQTKQRYAGEGRAPSLVKGLVAAKLANIHC